MTSTPCAVRRCARRASVLRSAMGILSLAIERCADLAEPLSTQLASVRELVVSLPAPRCDHRKHEDPAVANQVLIGSLIALPDFFGRMGDVELDRSTATRLEVHKQQPFVRSEQVARMRLAVQQLLVGAAVANRLSHASQRVAEKLPLGVSKLRS